VLGKLRGILARVCEEKPEDDDMEVCSTDF
jgi:hypothetical protein